MNHSISSYSLPKPIPIWRLSRFWLLLGLPAFRIYGSRSAMDSLDGGQDIWNIIRVVWWGCWGMMVVNELWKNRQWVRPFLSQLGYLPVFVGIWVTMLFVSTAVSPQPMFTFVNAGLMLILTLASLDLGVKLYTRTLSVQRGIFIWMGFALSLLILVWYLSVTNPPMVGWATYAGLRIRGGQIAYTPILSNLVFFTSLYLWLTSRHKYRWVFLVICAFGFHWLLMGQTRSAFLGFGLGVLVLAWRWGNLGRNYVRLLSIVSVLVALLCTIGLLANVSQRIRWEVDQKYKQYVIRDVYAVEDEAYAEKDITSLNGRIDVLAALWERAVPKPLGLGYIAGPRILLQSDEMVARFKTNAFGNSHNAYMEIWAGTGIFGFVAWISIVFWIVIRAFTRRSPYALLYRSILLALLVESMFESELVLPFKQSSASFWILMAFVAAMSVRPPRMTFRPKPRKRQPIARNDQDETKITHRILLPPAASG